MKVLNYQQKIKMKHRLLFVPKAEIIGAIIGEDNDLSDFIDIIDDDENCTIAIDDSKVNYDKVGEFQVSFRASDSAGNDSEITVPCYVVKKTPKKHEKE